MKPSSSLSRNNPLSRRVAEHLRPTMGRKKDTRDGFFDPATPAEHYAFDVGTRLSALLESMDALHQIPFYLTFYPSNRVYRQRGPSRPDWLRYHLENFYVRLRGVVDRAVGLISVVFQITESERPSFRRVLQFLKEHDLHMASELQTLGEHTLTFKSVRDELVHEGTYQDRSLRHLELLIMAIDDKWEAPFNLQDRLKSATADYVFRVTVALDRILEQVEWDCTRLIDALDYYYERTHNSLAGVARLDED